MKKVLLLLLVLTFVLAGGAIAADTITAHVSDSNCGAKHADHSEASISCAKRCVGNGADVVLVDEAGEVHVVANPEALKGHEGHQVTVMVTKGEDGKVTVDPENVKHVAP
jgi:hypothetical protein